MVKDVRRVGNLRETLLAFEHLYAAFRRAFRATKSEESYRFYYNLDRELLSLKEELRSGSYVPGAYRYFTIYEPKERIISVAPFRDRVVHHALVAVLEPVYERCFIHDSYATRKEKGTHRAITRCQRFLRKNTWFLKMDITRYFPSINHHILTSLLERAIKDRFVLNICAKLIARGGDGTTGLPIGNLTSQFFANVYLDPFDHFVKQDLRVKSYLRYMDDFCLFSSDKRQLLQWRDRCEQFLQDELRVMVKQRATTINNGVHGVPFLGMRVFPQLVRVQSASLNRSIHKIRLRESEYRSKRISYERYTASMNSLISHLKSGNRNNNNGFRPASTGASISIGSVYGRSDRMALVQTSWPVPRRIRRGQNDSFPGRW